MKITVLQVPYDSGYRGLRMGAGPSRLVEAGLLDRLKNAGHDTKLIAIELEPGFHTEVSSAFQLARMLHGHVSASLQRGQFPLILAGNCFAAVGIAAALQKPTVYWFDAHGDLNTPDTTRSGFLDGMALSVLLGRCWRELTAGFTSLPIPERQVCLLGARDLDPAEEDYLCASNVNWLRSAAELANSPQPNTSDSYLHIDLDVLDAAVGRANQYAVGGGFSVEELTTAVQRIGKTTAIRAAALTAFDPGEDRDGAVQEAAMQMAERIASVAAQPSLAPAP